MNPKIKSAINYLTGPPTVRPPVPVTIIGTYADGGAIREYPTTDADRAHRLYAGRLGLSDYRRTTGQPDGLIHLALIPTDHKGRCAQCAPIDGRHHVPESCPRALR